MWGMMDLKKAQNFNLSQNKFKNKNKFIKILLLPVIKLMNDFDYLISIYIIFKYILY